MALFIIGVVMKNRPYRRIPGLCDTASYKRNISKKYLSELRCCFMAWYIITFIVVVMLLVALCGLATKNYTTAENFINSSRYSAFIVEACIVTRLIKYKFYWKNVFPEYI
jgi:hypothetical protein